MSNSIFEKWIFEHAQYFAVIEQLNTDIVRVLEGATPIFFPLLGDSRTGKTALLKYVYARYAENKSSSGHSRVIFV